MSIEYFSLPANLPVPEDDGAADHLPGTRLPDLELPATTGLPVRLVDLKMAIIFAYPRTGAPDQHPGPDWEAIPGARGCTSQGCGFRDLRAEFDALGVQVLGLSTQSTEFQKEFAERVHIPFPILSDASLELVRRLRLPTFEFDVAAIGGGGPNTLIKRMAWSIVDGVIRHVWYPVFPPDRNADVVLAWLKSESNPKAIALGGPSTP